MPETFPWRQGESILDAVRRWDGSGDAEPVLPDEPPRDPSQIRWSAGSLEGTMTRHGLEFGLGEEQRQGRGIRARVRRFVGRERDVPAEIVSILERLVRRPVDDERLALYRVLQNEDVLPNVDGVLERLARDRDLLVAVAPHARWLVTEARHRAPLKFGIALLGVSGEPGDAELVKELGRHDEFTLYCSVALQHLVADPADALWEVARCANGWGKIEAVERLAPLVADRPDIRRWLLTDGCENAVMNEYLGYTCATAGGLRDALAGAVDDALLDGACTIARCRDILHQPHWPERLHEAFEHGERRGEWIAWRVGPLVGLDLWDAGFAKLKRDPLDDGLVFRLMHGSDRTHREQIVEWAEQHLPVEKIATGPAEHLFPAENREIDGALAFIVQEMSDGELYSERLVAAALVAPVIATRNQALNAIETQPRQAWGSSVEAALHRLTREDPNEDVRARAVGLLAER